MGKEKDELEEKQGFGGVVGNVKRMSSIKRKAVIGLVVILVCTLLGGVCGWRLHAYFTKEEPLSPDYITGKLQDASELTTQTITYTSRVPMTEGKIPFLTQKSFVMYYNATLRAGVDLSNVKVKERGDTIVVQLPHATVQGDPNIDPESIKFTDEKKALLNWNKKEDVTEALAVAQEDFENDPSIDMTLLLEQADEHAEELVHMLLDDVYDDREIEVEFKN